MKLNTVHVRFADPAHNYHTSVSAQATEASCKEYFVGKALNVGSIKEDNLQICTGIQFTDNNKPAMKLFDDFILSQYNDIVKHLYTFIHPSCIELDEERHRITVKGAPAMEMSFSTNEYKVYFFQHDQAGKEIGCFRITFRQGIIDYLNLKKIEHYFLKNNAG